MKDFHVGSTRLCNEVLNHIDHAAYLVSFLQENLLGRVDRNDNKP